MNTCLDYKTIYDKGWQQGLDQGVEDYGDLELDSLFLERTLPITRSLSIVEFGCGMGKLCNWLSGKGYRNIKGFDISSVAIATGKARFPHLDLSCADVNAISIPEGSIDVCLSFDFIEHLPDPASHFSAVRQMLKPHGRYLFQTPNMITNALYCTIQTRGFSWRITHPSLQTCRSLKKKLLNAGFSRVEFVKIPPLSEFKIRQIPRALQSIYTALPWTRLPLNVQIGFYVVAQR